MANTVTKPVGGMIAIAVVDEDWDFKSVFTSHQHQGIGVLEIELFDTGNSTIVIKDGAGGPTIFKGSCTATVNYRSLFYGKSIRPFIDVSDCTIGVAPTVLIKLA